MTYIKGTSLPSQTGNAGKYLTTDGANASWGTVVGGGSSTTLTQVITVTATISQGQVVNSDGSKGDSTATTKRNKAIGIADANITSGFSGNIITDGVITYGSWSWTAGDILYLNGTSLSTTAPSTGFVQKIGRAISSTKVEVEIGEAILL